MANRAMIVPKQTTSRFSLKICKKIGKNKADTMEAREIYLKISKIINQIKAKIEMTFAISIFLIASPINTPKLVAMPFPPLNLRNIVQLCPHILAKPNINLNESKEVFRLEVVKSAKSATGIIPFEISRSNPIIPILYPSTLAKLVAPMFPEPTLRKSIFLKTFAKIKAQGIEPKR